MHYFHMQNFTSHLRVTKYVTSLSFNLNVAQNSHIYYSYIINYSHLKLILISKYSLCSLYHIVNLCNLTYPVDNNCSNHHSNRFCIKVSEGHALGPTLDGASDFNLFHSLCVCVCKLGLLQFFFFFNFINQAHFIPFTNKAQ